MKKYKAKKGSGIKLLIAVCLFLPLLDIWGSSASLFILILLFIPATLLLWLYFDTSYKINGPHFYYRSAFLKGEIDIHSIKEIRKNTTIWTGTKPALASNGLLIKYKIYAEIYIAPEDNNILVADLLKVNPSIKVLE